MDNHRLHNYDETEAVANKRVSGISDLLLPAKKTLCDGKEKVDFKSVKEKLAAYHVELKASLKSSFEKMHKHLSERESFLLGSLQIVIEKQFLKIEDARSKFSKLSSNLEIEITDGKKLLAEPRSIVTITEGKRILSNLEKDIEAVTGLHPPNAQRKQVQLVFSKEDSASLKKAIENFGTLVDDDQIPIQIEALADDVIPNQLPRVASLPVMSSHLPDHLDDMESNSSVAMMQPTAIISCTEKEKKFYPCGIAVGSNNLITVSDLHNNLVKVLTSTGKVIDTIESTKGSRTFKGPCALHVDESNDIFILERDSKSIRKYTNGSLVDLGKFTKQFDDPRGIMVLDEKVYITDWKNNCIHILVLTNNKLSYQSSVGERFLKQPTGIGCSVANKMIVVSDQENHCVWVLTSEGDVVNVIGGEKGVLNGPYGVAVTSGGKVVISERGSSQISIFSLQGAHVMSFGCKGHNPGQFNQLRHVCSNFTNQILVADEMNQRVQIFDI